MSNPTALGLAGRVIELPPADVGYAGRVHAADDRGTPGQGTRSEAPTLPRWLGGDWSEAVRDPIDLLRLALLAGVPVTLALGPREQSLRLLLTFGLVLLPRALDAPRPFDLAFVAAMSLQAWGNVFEAFEVVYGYDKLVHFLLPCAASALLYLALVRVGVVPDLAEEAGVRHRPALLLVTAALGLAMMGGLYEVYEWFADNALGARLHVSYGDSIGDLLADLGGALAGGCLILVWEARGWGTRRRPNPPPGAEVRDDPVVELGDRAVARLRPDASGRPGRGGPGLPKPLAGDWRGALRDPLDLLRLTFLIGMVVAIGTAEWETALRFTLSFAAAVAARGLDAPRPFDLLFLAALAMQAWGTLAGVFGSVGGFDSATHVVVSAAVAPILYIAVVRSRLLPELSRSTSLHQGAAIVLVVFSLGFSAGILYELYAYLVDHLLDASIVSDYPLFIGRLAFDMLGSLVGAALVACWGLGEWPLRRVGAEEADR